jgi:Leucine-rich repeat (LRR) protein
LDLGGNCIETIPECIYNLTHLFVLSLDQNKLTEDALQKLKNGYNIFPNPDAIHNEVYGQFRNECPE